MTRPWYHPYLLIFGLGTAGAAKMRKPHLKVHCISSQWCIKCIRRDTFMWPFLHSNNRMQERSIRFRIIYLADVTVLLSLTVFMNLVSAIMPTTSDAVPLIGNHCVMHSLLASVFLSQAFFLRLGKKWKQWLEFFFALNLTSHYF